MNPKGYGESKKQDNQSSENLRNVFQSSRESFFSAKRSTLATGNAGTSSNKSLHGLRSEFMPDELLCPPMSVRNSRNGSFVFGSGYDGGYDQFRKEPNKQSSKTASSKPNESSAPNKGIPPKNNNASAPQPPPLVTSESEKRNQLSSFTLGTIEEEKSAQNSRVALPEEPEGNSKKKKNSESKNSPKTNPLLSTSKFPNAKSVYDQTLKSIEKNSNQATEQLLLVLLNRLLEPLKEESKNMMFSIHWTLYEESKYETAKKLDKHHVEINKEIEAITKLKTIQEKMLRNYKPKLVSFLKNQGFSVTDCEEHSKWCLVIGWDQSQEQSVKVKEENHMSSKVCEICQTNERSVVLGCGHLFCESCPKKLTKKECPVCRKPITGISKIFI